MSPTWPNLEKKRHHFFQNLLECFFSFPTKSLGGEKLKPNLCLAYFWLNVDGSEIPNNHLGCKKTPCKEWDFNYQPQLVIAGFLNHQQYLEVESTKAICKSTSLPDFLHIFYSQVEPLGGCEANSSPTGWRIATFFLSKRDPRGPSLALLGKGCCITSF